MDNEDEGARLTRREENRELIAKHRAEVETGTTPFEIRKKIMTAHMLAESIVERATVATPITNALVLAMQAGWLSLGSSAPGAVKPLVEALEAFERELIDLKQRLLPQFQGRAERAENAKRKAEWARDAMLEQLIAARSATAAPDRPDWAQQLPGAEIFDRAARYEYLRTLNPREFAALYDEALHGTADNFDDLVDRRRMKRERSDDAGEQP